MPRPITKNEIADRLRDYTFENYLYINSIIKGIALYFATLALSQIFTDFKWARLAPWLASMAAILVSYSKWARGALITNSRANIRDTTFPLLMGVAEFFLFSILISDDTKKDAWHQEFWLNWLFVLAAHSLFAAGLVWNRISTVNLELDFAADPQDDANNRGARAVGMMMDKWIRVDRRGASIFGAAALLAWIVVRFIILPEKGPGVAGTVQAWVAGFFFFGFCKIIYDANAERRIIDSLTS